MTFRERLDGKAWKALQAMIDGLKRNSKRVDFFVNMDTFGANIGPLCFGCAATCTIQEVAKKKLRYKTINRSCHHVGLGVRDGDDLDVFESVIDSARTGDMRKLFRYMGYGYDTIHDQYQHLPRLNTGNWKRELHKYQDYTNKLKSLNI